MSKNRRCKAPLEGIMNQTESLVTEIQKGNRRQRGGHPECIDGGSGKGHILLEDIPGVGKTTLALAFSKVLGMDYKRIQFTPDVIPSDVVGFTVYDKKTDSFIYKPGAVMCNLLLADEINRTSSKTQAALLEVMEEGSVTVDGKTYPVPQPFAVLSTQNPFGSAGTQMLPQSQLDRFMVKLSMGYPDFDSQVNILRDRQNEQPLDSLETDGFKRRYHEHAAGGSAGDGQGQHPALHHHAGGEYEEARADPARSQPARGTRSQQHGEGGGVCLRQGVCDP